MVSKSVFWIPKDAERSLSFLLHRLLSNKWVYKTVCKTWCTYFFGCFGRCTLSIWDVTHPTQKALLPLYSVSCRSNKTGQNELSSIEVIVQSANSIFVNCLLLLLYIMSSAIFIPLSLSVASVWAACTNTEGTCRLGLHLVVSGSCCRRWAQIMSLSDSDC